MVEEQFLVALLFSIKVLFKYYVLMIIVCCHHFVNGFLYEKKIFSISGIFGFEILNVCVCEVTGKNYSEINEKNGELTFRGMMSFLV